MALASKVQALALALRPWPWDFGLVYITAYGSQKFGDAGASPLGDVDVAVPIKICFSFTGVTMQNMVILIKTTIEIWRSARKFWPLTPHPCRSLKVIGTDTDRSATYDFLLVFHLPISYRYK